MTAWFAMTRVRLRLMPMLGVVLLLGLAVPASASDHFALIVSGASGSKEVAESQQKWRVTLAKAMRVKAQMPVDHIIVLSDQPSDGSGENGSGVPERLATRENVDASFSRLTRGMKQDDVLLVVLIGHSTYDGVDAKFNLVGPDFEANDWQRLVSTVPGRVVFVNTTGASAPFMTRLAGPRRIVITATDNPAQRYDTIFPEFFSQAFDSPEADLDKDGRVSIWEAFAYASGKVRMYYRQRGQLSVEHPVLDDTGDGVGKDSTELGPDGAVASRTFLDAGNEPVADANPALSELINRRNTLETEFDELKRRREFMPSGDYEKQRDLLLIDIARISHQIRVQQTSSS
jgi:hypothetical protein